MPSRIPAFGQAAPCKPAFYPKAKTGMIQWAWCPEFSWLAILLLLTVGVIALGFILLVVNLAAAVIVILIGVFSFWIILNWYWNANKQAAYMIARGKSVEAKEMWKVVDENFLFMAKDTFYETRYGGKVLRVLRDGTIEVLGCHGELDIDGIDVGISMDVGGEGGEVEVEFGDGGVEQNMESMVGKVVRNKKNKIQNPRTSNGGSKQTYVTREEMADGTVKITKTTIDEYGNKTVEETLEQLPEHQEYDEESATESYDYRPRGPRQYVDDGDDSMPYPQRY